MSSRAKNPFIGLDGLGGVPVSSFAKLAELCCFTPEPDGIFTARQMIEQDLRSEQKLIEVIRRLASQAESLGDRATRYLYDGRARLSQSALPRSRFFGAIQTGINCSPNSQVSYPRDNAILATYSFTLY
jgi:hypothetical protein